METSYFSVVKENRHFWWWRYHIIFCQTLCVSVLFLLYVVFVVLTEYQLIDCNVWVVDISLVKNSLVDWKKNIVWNFIFTFVVITQIHLTFFVDNISVVYISLSKIEKYYFNFAVITEIIILFSFDRWL